jgi:hypothetical protein
MLGVISSGGTWTTVKRIRFEKSKNGGSVPGRIVDYLQIRSGAHRAYYSVGTEALDTAVKRSAGA